jgi:hypothetical protein
MTGVGRKRAKELIRRPTRHKISERETCKGVHAGKLGINMW